MAKHQIRLTKEVAALVKKSATTSLRSIPQEVNFLLLEALAKKAK